MICPRCGASTEGQICEYCGSALESEKSTREKVRSTYRRTVEPSRRPAAGYTREVTERDEWVSDRSRGTTLLICIFFGWLGIHQFYCRRIGWGIAYLLTLGLFGVGWIVDIVRLALGIFRDKEGRELKDWTIYPEDRIILIILAAILIVRLVF